MFSVIGADGHVFRGSLEHLLATHRVPPLRRMRGIGQDGEEAPPSASGNTVPWPMSWKRPWSRPTRPRTCAALPA